MSGGKEGRTVEMGSRRGWRKRRPARTLRPLSRDGVRSRQPVSAGDVEPILIAGLPGHFGTWLAERLPRTTVQVAFSADEAVDHARGGALLLLLDLAIGADETVQALRTLRALPRGTAVPVVVTVDPGESGVDEGVLDRLVRDLRVERILFHPLDRAELLRSVSQLVGASAAQARQPAREAPVPASPPAAPRPSAPAAAARESVSAAVDQLWARARGAMLERVDVLERAARAAAEGRLTGALRQQATDEAHRLAGALGTFGLPEGSRSARELEAQFGGGKYLTQEDGARLAAAAAALRGMIESRRAQPAPAAAPATSSPAQATGAPSIPLLLAVTGDPALASAARGLASPSLRVEVAGDGDALAAERPAAVLLDVSAPDATSDWRALGEVAQRHPGVPILVATARGALPDRLRAVQLGARSFLQKPLTADALRDAVAGLLPAPGAPRARVLCVDDDEQLLGAVRALLEPQRIEVHTLSDPLHFWTRLGEVDPDLLVLDIEMPHVNGIELCRVVRADPRRRALPVVFLTSRTEPESVYRVFAAGADDFVAKPFVGPELIARIRNRLERVRS
jgi:DNA-binding response OmpR family regulator/HPt (histidine-containing phosphotransfer) domain-containing protein